MDLALDATKRPTRRLRRLLAPFAGEYEYVFLDCPPSISLVSESVFEAADVLLVPVIPATLSSRTFRRLCQLADEARDSPRVLGFFSMVDARRRLHRDVIEELSADPAMLATAIPAASDVERMGRLREPIAVSAPSGRAGRAYEALWAEIGARL
jgi:cellulose biosynthesis protein BcsQ